MNYTVKLIAVLNEDLLEGPIFDKDKSLLYFVSILDFRVYRYEPSTDELIYIQFDSPTSCVFITYDFGIVAATTLGFFSLNFEALTYTKLFKIDIPFNMRFNDGITDPKGRFLIGTMGYPEIIENAGSLLSYKDGQVLTLIPNTTISNGISFTKDATTMYFIDTPTRTVKEYKYDVETGSCVYRKELIKFTGKGVPDGMDIDIDGNLWIAEWGGNCVSIWESSTGENIGRIEIPSENVTSICFDNSYNLFVTSAKSFKEDVNKGGSLYYVKIEKDEYYKSKD